MIKLVYCITKKPGLTYEEFFNYWKNIHGPIGARISGLRKLIQSHTIEGTKDIRNPDFDGMAELWFDNMDALLQARKSLEWKLSTDDEKNFTDPAKTAFFITEEHQIN